MSYVEYLRTVISIYLPNIPNLVVRMDLTLKENCAYIHLEM
ncbi:hypothetical protein BpJC4_29780 [Weizmannia acidilactici]|nr:hypothetical protein BpJC4_29780 [Weizmannia acidilactici]GER75083.1 hypothetical protein BpPP18_31500 [Weizmannia acidilactici]